MDERLLVGKRVLDGASDPAGVGAISRPKAGESERRLAERGRRVVRHVRRNVRVASGAIPVLFERHFEEGMVTCLPVRGGARSLTLLKYP